jgi:curved DNA binding protein
MSDNESSGSNDSKEDTNDLSNPDVINKYRTAGEFANFALNEVLKACQVGAKVIDLCKLGDEQILSKTNTVFNKTVLVKGEKVKVEKGVAFPTCISINNVLGNFCPRESDSVVTLQKGDVAKIELGVHLDGYIAIATHTIVVGEEEATGRKADVILAAQTALEASLRLIKPGTQSSEIIDVVKRVSAAYGVTAVDSVACSTMRRFVIESNKHVPIAPRPEEKNESFAIEENDVFALEFSFTTGDIGKCSDKDGNTTVFRRAVDVTYMLKLKAARTLLSEINALYPSVPFSFRTLEAKLGATAKLGLRELLDHQLLHPYPVMTDKKDEFIATFKCTCLVTANGLIKITGLDYPKCNSTKTVTDEKVVKLLKTSLKTNKKKKKAAAKKDEEEDD